MKRFNPIFGVLLGFSIFFQSGLAANAEGISVKSFFLTADKQIAELYLNGIRKSLGKNANNWKKADEYGPIEKLRVVAVRAEGTKNKDSALIGMIVLEDGTRVVTDELWKVYYAKGGSPPPQDSRGNKWFEEDYDDSMWDLADPLSTNPHGNYGAPPWGIDYAGMNEEENNAKKRNSFLDNAMSVLDKEGHPIQRANWIWKGNSTYAVTPVYFRRSFVLNSHTQKQPPTRPTNFKVSEITSDRVVLNWNVSHSIQKDFVYEVYWNGFPLFETKENRIVITEKEFPGGLRITSFPQIFFYVKAKDIAGNRSGPTLFRHVTLPGISGNSYEVPPPTVKNMRVVKKGEEYVVVKWDRPPGRHGNAHYYDIINTKVRKRGFGGTGGGRCVAAVTKLEPGTEYEMEMRLNTTRKRKSAAFSEPIRVRTLPKEGDKIPPSKPENVKVENKKEATFLKWDKAKDNQKIRGYRVYRNGKSFKDVITKQKLELELPKGKNLESYQVTALDEAGNESLRSIPVVAFGQDKTPPTKPQLFDIGRTDRVAIIRWLRAQDNAGLVRYRLVRKEAGVQDHVVWLNKKFQDHGLENQLRVTGLESGTEYTFELTAEDGSSNTSEMVSMKIETVYPPDTKKKPLAVFGYALHAKTHHDHLKMVLDHMQEEQCELAIIGGSIGVYNVKNDNNWNNIKKLIAPYEGKLPIYFNPGGHDKMPGIRVPKWIERSRLKIYTYNSFIHHAGPRGQLHQTWRKGPILFAKTMDGGTYRFEEVESKSQEFILETLMQAERDPEVKWLFLKGGAVEYGLTNYIPMIMYQTFKPFVCLDRPTNGNPGYEVFWFPGDNFAVTCPQRMRAKRDFGYYKIYVYEDRILFESYNYNRKEKKLILSVRHEIEYDRVNNHIRPSMARWTGGGSPYEGHRTPYEMTEDIPWAQNQFVFTEQGREVDFKLLGRSPSSKSLKYEITAQPEHGKLRGEAPNLTFVPEKGFTGKDRVFYRVNDGKDSNMAWISIEVK